MSPYVGSSPTLPQLVDNNPIVACLSWLVTWIHIKAYVYMPSINVF